MDELDISNLLISMNKYILNRKDYIKKYYKLRKIHADVLESMWNYINTGKYDMDYYLDKTKDNVEEEMFRFGVASDLELSMNNADDLSIFTELIIYQNHPDIIPVTKVYLEKNKFKNVEKIKFLKAMNDSHASLFKVIAVDPESGYVTYEDVFTGKKYKVIDIAQSSTLKINNKHLTYVYNRLITYEDITFGTGIHCMMDEDTKGLKEFIKKYKLKKCSDFARCLILYYIFKHNGNLKLQHHHNYGKRR